MPQVRLHITIYWLDMSYLITDLAYLKVGRYFIKYIAVQAELRIYIMVIIVKMSNNCNR